MVLCQRTTKTENKSITLKKIAEENATVLNATQREVYDLAMQGINLFVTGSGGVGKSFLLNAITLAMKANKKNVLITGSTGVASQNIRGITVHKAFGLPADVCFTEKKGDHVVHAPKNIVNTDVFILDEISMVRRDVFDSVYLSLQKANQKRLEMKKPPIQMLVFGDFAQLPPVLTEEDRERLRYYYGEDVKGGYAFQSPHWDECNFKFCELTEVVRQDDQDDVKHLNDIRFGKMDTVDYFNRKASHGKPFENAVSLYSYNRDVERRNREELAKLPDPEYSFDAILKGQTTKAEVEEHSFNYNLTVKYGAKVMITCNPAANADFYEVLGPEEFNSISTFANGTIGKVVAINVNPNKPEEDYIAVMVKVEDEERYIHFYRKAYELYEYKTSKYGKLSKYVRGTYKQFPLRLCYGMTIHKSQGCSFDYVNINPRNFSHGQLYVALSRCRKIKNICLENYIRQEDIIFDQDVLDFYKKCRTENIPTLFEMERG